MNIYKKLQQARISLQARNMIKSGNNKFAGYKYFELSDYLPDIQKIFNDIGLCGVVSFKDVATLTIIDTDDSTQQIVFESPMSEANLKGCHPVQNLGAVETYIRRYLYQTALEIVEHDAINSSRPVDNKSQAQNIDELLVKISNISSKQDQEACKQLIANLGGQAKRDANNAYISKIESLKAALAKNTTDKDNDDE
jgi:hypothetical protein